MRSPPWRTSLSLVTPSAFKSFPHARFLAAGTLGMALRRCLSHSFLAISGPVMRLSSGIVAAMMPSESRMPATVMR